jgi:hypothetical protein
LKKIVFVLLGVFCVFAPSSFAAFDAQGYVLEDGQLYRVDAKGKGKKERLEGASLTEALTEGGKIYWLAADPDGDEEHAKVYKGWKSGIYFFGDDGKFISVLERENPQISDVYFSPDGGQFVLDSGTYVERDYELYAFDGLKLKKKFFAMGEPIWLDSTRFAFTLIDKTQKRPGSDISGGLSVVVFDSATGSLQTVAQATKTVDFYLVAVEGEEFLMAQSIVEDEKDWADEGKKAEVKNRYPIPPKSAE